MTPNYKYLTGRQLVFLFVGSKLFLDYTHLPLINTPPENQDVWITEILSIVFSVIFVIPILLLITNFKGKSFSEMVCTILGNKLGKAVGIIYAVFMTFGNFICILMILIFMNAYVFAETPPWAILIFTLLPALYSSYKGILSIGRTAVLFAGYAMVTILLFSLCGYPEMDYRLILPVLSDSTSWQILSGAFFLAARYSEIVLFMFLAVYFSPDLKVVKTAVLSIILGAVFTLLMALPTLTVLGNFISQHVWNPYYLYCRQIHIYDFIQRADSLSFIAWYILAIFKLSIYNFIAAKLLSDVFGTKSHKPFTFILITVLSVVCLLPMFNCSTFITQMRSYNVITWFVFPFIFILPLIILIVYLIRKAMKKLAVSKQ